jgi:signal transduction histidine kinase
VVHGLDPENLASVRRGGIGPSDPEIILIDEGERICWINPVAKNRLGPVEAERAVGQLLCDVPSLSGAEPLPCEGRSVRLSPHTKQAVICERTSMRLPDGRQLMAIRQFAPAAAAHDTLASSSEQWMLWAAVGAVTTGLAHEMRNPMTALEMRLSALKGRPTYALNEAARTAVGEIQDLVSRISGIVENLCSFGREDLPLRTLVLRPAALAYEALQDALETDLNSDTQVEATVNDEADGTIQVDLPRMRRALRDVISNGIEAMAGEGRLTITLTGHGGWCHIDVADTGPGIPPEIRPRLGQPFVTSKPAGTGSGLGLSLCGLTVERHGGHMRLTQTGADGTTMRISLPGFTPTGGAI